MHRQVHTHAQAPQTMMAAYLLGKCGSILAQLVALFRRNLHTKNHTTTNAMQNAIQYAIFIKVKALQILGSAQHAMQATIKQDAPNNSASRLQELATTLALVFLNHTKLHFYGILTSAHEDRLFNSANIVFNYLPCTKLSWAQNQGTHPPGIR